MRVKTWIIIDRGSVPKNSPTIPYECECGHEAELPVRGRALAILEGGGVIFDNDCKGAMPAKIKCRKCGRVLEQEVPSNVR